MTAKENMNVGCGIGLLSKFITGKLPASRMVEFFLPNK